LKRGKTQERALDDAVEGELKIQMENTDQQALNEFKMLQNRKATYQRKISATSQLGLQRMARRDLSKIPAAYFIRFPEKAPTS
jgi:hypothetical protein